MTDHVGSLLSRAGLITQEQLRTAIAAIAAVPGRTLVEELVVTGAISEERLCRFFHDRLLVPIIGPTELTQVSRRSLRHLAGDMAAEFRCVPLHVDAHRNLVLAMSDPSDTHAVDEVQFATGMTVFRVAAPASAIAKAVLDLYGISSPLAQATVEAGVGVDPVVELEAVRLKQRKPEPTIETPPLDLGEAAQPPPPKRTLPPAVIVEDVYAEDTPIPQPVPFDQTTGRIVLIDPRSLATTLAQMDRRPEIDPAAETALREAVLALEVAGDSDAIAGVVVTFMKKLCRRGAFFVVRRGQLAGWMGLGQGVRVAALRQAVLALDKPSTFRDLILTRLPFRGPVLDAASRDFLIDGLGWAPRDMLAIPLAVRDRVVAVAYGDERVHPLPDEFLQSLARAAELALDRAIVARRQP